MNKNTIFWMIIVGCAICIAGLVWKCQLQSQTIDAYGDVLSFDRNIIEIEDQLRDLRKKEILSLQSNGYEIPGMGINNRQNNGQQRVYLRLHQGICAACYINSVIDICNMFSSDSIPVSVVGSYQHQSTYDDLLRECGLIDMANINESSLLYRIPADTADAPYVFTMNERGAIKNTLFLDKSVMDSEKATAYKRMMYE